ncbi:extracellular solute-binding protein [Paenibacillus amylolyticus]|nr:extracellular solute-binding protein [Paenibacillus amylolyticus]WFR65634.1 extracellular solute-binding protein [Paenibacillus amylolyticus]
MDVQFVPVPRSEEVQKLNVLMASGSEVPDIVFTYDSGTFNRYAEQGGLTELTDLINQSGPNLKKFLGDETLAYGQYDGNSSRFQVNVLYLASTHLMFVRTGWTHSDCLHLRQLRSCILH